MSTIRIKKLGIKNYRSFGDSVVFDFPNSDYKKPVAIVGYNNSGKTNLLNSILYGITEKYVNRDTFSINDFHNKDYNNVPSIVTLLESSIEKKSNGKEANLTGRHDLLITVDELEIIDAKIESYKDSRVHDNNKNFNAFGAAKYYNIFYINFHEIKKEISTQKTSWGNLTSFLAKHIKKIVESDTQMISKKQKFNTRVKCSTKEVLKDSALSKFIKDIKDNYSLNLRDNNCEIDFGLPEYEDIFLEMMFKIGLNGNKENLVPIDHFGDGYISMFVMAVIKSIAESNDNDKCLFLFEEPESFLHENHQEYFYKMILCGLSEKGHQVIYTTHSDRMVDVFDTQGLIRIEYDEENNQTVKKYNNISPINLEGSEVSGGITSFQDYNNYIKILEPSLNKILFSKKVLLVEGPNDMMTYKYIIERELMNLGKDKKYAETFLNFKNISIVPHHGKSTAIYLIEICKHLKLDFFVINDFDFIDNYIEKLNAIPDDFQNSLFYNNEISTIKALNKKGEQLAEKTKKAMMTNNYNLLKAASLDKIHFNIPRLEEVLNYDSNDKDSYKIWLELKKIESFNETIFPQKLRIFLEIESLL